MPAAPVLPPSGPGDEAQRLRLLADHVPALIAYYETEGLRCNFANRRYAETFGFTTETILGLSVREVVGEAGWAQIGPMVERVIREHEGVSYERELVSAAGQQMWIEVELVPHLDTDGQLLGAFVRLSDVTRHRQAEREARESEARLAKFMEASAEGIVFHRNALVVDVNPALCALLGYARDELIGRRTTEFVAPAHVPRVIEVIGGGADLSYEVEVVHRDGTLIPVELLTRVIALDGEHLRFVIVRDIRDRLAAQARINHLAHHDALTGLPNRIAFVQQLDRMAASHRAGEARFALLFIDLDHFKRVNDSLGHLAGDTLLQTVATRITGALRDSDRVARFGGDEFMVLAAGAHDVTVVEQVAAKLLAAIEAPITVGGRPISVSPSIGVALFPEDGRTPAELIQHADAAMYLAKARGRANVQFFDPTLSRNAYAALVMEGQLAQAIATNAFRLQFQPQVREFDGAMVGAEALIRWQHPERGLLMPDVFMPVAEARRLMVPIGQWVMREALQSARRWRAAGLTAPVAVNLSTLQFQQHGFVDGLAHLLEELQVPGDALELELTERMLMDDLVEVKRKLQALQALGIRIAVDDFGTGYSSLRHLKDLPINKIKIDRSFVKDLTRDRDALAITQAIVQLAHSLGMAVVAEGVETIEQRRVLADLGCDVQQGHLVAPPLDESALLAWARQRAPVDRSIA
ncbi:putative bifunctional diguanylate cyclase/phosphodiesterase [Rivibacter subsaxonicus]|uniref:PAS domain S-box-containing protein/diguanylate cyclase (GGDEF)-like protein n=1 Tax=Rivibacter subsaxonicus TaxID=457575 RepID=A0A4Q7W0M8_9BURK|nr:EAL domain-containing protein [Rivibacter subsaxonicus]RZU02741.1 PAS domain S-box-containing protein/diguanylate cyclase (GGDEF)-like protein [Rivibacter subsaxonicus]